MMDLSLQGLIVPVLLLGGVLVALGPKIFAKVKELAAKHLDGPDEPVLDEDLLDEDLLDEDGDHRVLLFQFALALRDHLKDKPDCVKSIDTCIIPSISGGGHEH